MLRDIEGVRTKANHKERVVYDTASSLYKKMERLTRKDRTVLDNIVACMDSGLNTIVLLKDTLEYIVSNTGYSRRSVKRSQVTLIDLGFMESTGVLVNEHIVPFSFCWKGSYKATAYNKGKIANQAREIDGRDELSWRV
jgi:hypothetical protein